MTYHPPDSAAESLLRSLTARIGASGGSSVAPIGGFSEMRSGKKIYPPVVPPLTPGRFPYYEMIPTDLAENLRFRRAMMWAGFSSRESARTIWCMCARDVLFWMNCFVWTLDPRTKKSGGVATRFSANPFITYPFQNHCFEKLDDWLGECDIHWDKSRDMGASWVLICAMFHRVWFEQDQQSYLLISQKFDLVDDRNEPDSLFPKLDFVLQHTPSWLKPPFRRTEAKILNPLTGSILRGTATTEDAGRGGRKRAILVDEAGSVASLEAMIAAVSDATDSLILSSTPKGDYNEFAKRRHTTPARLTTHWSLHPRKSKGMWQDDQGRLRSPWYDAEVLRRANPRMVAQELDIDYLGSGQGFFAPEGLEKAKVDQCRDPLSVGELTVNDRTWAVRGYYPSSDGVGRVSLWMGLVNGRPPVGQYVLAADVAQGTGASNSVISGWHRRTREQVLEFSSPHISPEGLGKLMLAMAWWMVDEDDEPAFLIWEAPGPGRTVGNVIVREKGFRNVFWTRDETGLARKRKAGRIPGWTPTGDSKDELLMEFQRAWVHGRMTVRSDMVYREAEKYEFGPDGHVVSADSVSNDPSGAKKNHGDRVTAAALAWHVLKESYVEQHPETMAEDLLDVTPELARSAPDDEVPASSFEWRRRNQTAKMVGGGFSLIDSPRSGR